MVKWNTISYLFVINIFFCAHTCTCQYKFSTLRINRPYNRFSLPAMRITRLSDLAGSLGLKTKRRLGFTVKRRAINIHGSIHNFPFYNFNEVKIVSIKYFLSLGLDTIVEAIAITVRDSSFT